MEAFAKAGLPPLTGIAIRQFAIYLDLLQRWNARLNLSSIRAPEAIIERHFVESAFAVQHLPANAKTLLDFGSGAGFPGLPIAICDPQIRITAAESQAKKASFLREVLRATGLAGEIYYGRVETMSPERRFDCVTMRAVERMEEMARFAFSRADKSLILFATEGTSDALVGRVPEASWDQPVVLPGADHRVLLICHRQ